MALTLIVLPDENLKRGNFARLSELFGWVTFTLFPDEAKE